MEQNKFNLPKGYLSASSIGTFLRCPKQFEFRYVYDIISPPSAALVTGKAVHSTLEEYFKDYLQSKKRMNEKETGELSVAILDSTIEEEDFKFSPKEYDETIYEVKDLVENYVKYVACTLEPVAVEKEINYTTDMGVNIIGYIDLEIKKLDALNIIDYKVTSKKWTKNKLVNSLQFNIYSIATGVNTIEVHNMVKLGAPTKVLPEHKRYEEEGIVDYTNKLRVLEHKFDNSAKQHFEEIIHSVAKAVSLGLFIPCDPESWCCNETWCGYWDRCRGKQH